MSMEETLEENVVRKLKEKTGIYGEFYMEQLYTKSELNRDARGRVISCSYLGIAREGTLKGDLLSVAQWHSVQSVLAAEGLESDERLIMEFDHREIIKYALERIAGKVGYTNIAFELLPEQFTLNDLESVYELLLNRKLLNFRRKMTPYIEETGELRTGSASRPAMLYRRNKVPIQW